MEIKRRGFLAQVITAGAGVVALVKSWKAVAKGLPSDPGAQTGTAGPEEILLPPFEKNLSFPLEQALLKRKTDRAFDPTRQVSLEQLSRLLWAANGVNRPNGHRTTPSAMAWYPVEIYVALAQGAYKFDLKAHKLKRVTTQDLRDQVPVQADLKKASVKILYVVNNAKIQTSQAWMADLEIGCMVQDVYLEAAALGLGCCVFAIVQYDKVTKALGLTNVQKLRIAQAVGPLVG